MQNGGVGPFLVNNRRVSPLTVAICLCCLAYALLLPSIGLGFLPGDIEFVDWWDRGASLATLSLGILAAGLLTAELASPGTARLFGLLSLLLLGVGSLSWAGQTAYWLAFPMVLSAGVLLLLPSLQPTLRRLFLLSLVIWPALLMMLVALTPTGTAPVLQTYLSVPALMLFLLLGLAFHDHTAEEPNPHIHVGHAVWPPVLAFLGLLVVTMLFAGFLPEADRETTQAVLAGGVLIALLVAVAMFLGALARLREREAGEAARRIQQAQHDLEHAGREQRRLSERLADTLDGLGDAFLMLGPDGRISYGNPQSARLLAAGGNSLTGTVLWEAGGVGASASLREACGRVLRERVPETLEVFDDGWSAWLELRVFPTDEGLALYGRDATEQKQLGDAMRVQAQIIDQMHDAVIGIDANGRVSIWNRGAQRLFGLRVEEAIGQPLPMLFPGDDGSSSSLLKDIMKEEAVETETRMRCRGGELCSVWLSTSRLRKDGGEEFGVLMLVMDIGDRKRSEQQVNTALAKARAYADQLQALATLFVRIGALKNIQELLQLVVDEGRQLIGAHQAAISVLEDGKWSSVWSSVSLSDKYAQYRKYAEPPLGAGIYRLVTDHNRSMRLTQAELEVHPAWRAFGDEEHRHPPMAGWLAVPLVLKNGSNLGVLQFSDRYRGDFTADDEVVARQLAQMAAVGVENLRLLMQLNETQKQQQEQTAFMMAIAQSLGEGVMVLDGEGCVEMVNQACERLLGCSRDALRGEDPWPVLNLEQPSQDQLFRGMELVLGRQDGKRVVLYVVANKLRGLAFRSGIVLIFRDISAEKESRRQLEERERFFRLSSEVMVISERDGTVLHINDAFEAVLGYPSETVLGDLGANYVVPEDRDQVAVRMRELHAGAESVQIEVRHRRVDGELIWLDWRATLGPHGQVFAVGRDVTERKAAEAVVQQTLAHLEARNHELQDFAFIASHDLQEPLRKIQAFSDRLVQRYADRLDEQGRDYLERMHGATGRMQGLLDSLLTYSRVTSRAAEFRQHDLSELAGQVLQDLEELIRRTGARIEVDTLFFGQVDPAQFRQLLQNLIANAIKFQPAGQMAEIRISSEEAPPFRLMAASGRLEQVAARVIVVSDNGIGIDPRYGERIFAPFRRLHGRQDYEGLGMGLAIVRKIVERHGGSVSVISRPGEGATFRVVLPLRQPGQATQKS